MYSELVAYPVVSRISDRDDEIEAEDSCLYEI